MNNPIIQLLLPMDAPVSDPKAGLPPKVAMIRALAHGFESLIAAFAAWIAAQMATVQLVEIIAWCVVGACICGYIASVIAHILPGPDVTLISDRKRWLVNSLGGIVFAPFATMWLHDNWFPEAQIQFLALATSGLFGIFFVTGIFILPQYLAYKKAVKDYPIRDGYGNARGGNAVTPEPPTTDLTKK